jgi:Flp pilus assembly protein TadB
MRDDSTVDIVFVFLALATVASAIDGAFRSGADGPTWDLRWRALEPAERTRISAAIRSRGKLTDPVDTELAEGFNRYERRRGARLDLASAPLILLPAALTLAGVLRGGDFGLVVSLGVIFSAYVSPWLIKRKDRTSRLKTAPDIVL